jgi:hypothetical protein
MSGLWPLVYPKEEKKLVMRILAEVFVVEL